MAEEDEPGAAGPLTLEELPGAVLGRVLGRLPLRDLAGGVAPASRTLRAAALDEAAWRER